MGATKPGRAAVLALIGSLITGCAGTRNSMGPDAAKATVQDVTVTADAQAWTPKSEPTGHVLPILVKVANTSGRKVRIALEGFSLRSAKAKPQSALPVFRILGASMASARVSVPGTWTGWGGPAAKKLFESQEAYLAAPYAEYYGNVLAWRGPFPFDSARYDRLYSRWSSPGPTWEMTMNALPEAVLGPHGLLEGVVFFERPATNEQLTMYLELHDGDSGEALGTAELPIVGRSASVGAPLP